MAGCHRRNVIFLDPYLHCFFSQNHIHSDKNFILLFLLLLFVIIIIVIIITIIIYCHLIYLLGHILNN